MIPSTLGGVYVLYVGAEIPQQVLDDLKQLELENAKRGAAA